VGVGLASPNHAAELRLGRFAIRLSLWLDRNATVSDTRLESRLLNKINLKAWVGGYCTRYHDRRAGQR
jgi:hypothetical protein